MKPELEASKDICRLFPDKCNKHGLSMELCSEQNWGALEGHLFVTQTDLKPVFKFSQKLILHKLSI